MTAETRFDVSALLRRHDVMSEVIVVIGPVGDPFGTITALSKRRRTFSVHDLSFMQSVANVLATAVERFKSDEGLKRRVRPSAPGSPASSTMTRCAS